MDESWRITILCCFPPRFIKIKGIPMRRITSLIFILLFSTALFAQYQKMLNELEDSQTEESTGNLVLRVTNAITGAPVDDGNVAISGVGDYVTDLSGRIMVEALEDGKYYFKFSKPGFITSTYNFDVQAGTIFSNNFSGSPKMEMGGMRIVLNWDKKPAHLDLHLVKENSYHISYRHKIKASDGAAILDKDDQNGYGPETITICQVDNAASYTCYVQNYSNRRASRSTALSASKACIRVYNNNELIQTLFVPVQQEGTIWTVFQIHSGKIKAIQTLESK
jgi:hypothetical protein